MIPLEDDTLRSIWVEVELQDTGKQNYLLSLKGIETKEVKINKKGDRYRPPTFIVIRLHGNRNPHGYFPR